MADLKTAPLWLVRFNTVLLWLNPALGLVAVVLALLVIVEAGQRASVGPARAVPQVVRLAAAPSLDLCGASALPPEIRDMSLHD